MTDHPVPAYVHKSETTRREVWVNGNSHDGSGAYLTVLTVVIKTADLTRIDLTRPIEIHQGDTDD